jgi:hypothetical protein
MKQQMNSSLVSGIGKIFAVNESEGGYVSQNLQNRSYNVVAAFAANRSPGRLQ